MFTCSVFGFYFVVYFLTSGASSPEWVYPTAEGGGGIGFLFSMFLFRNLELLYVCFCFVFVFVFVHIAIMADGR
jgi:hypothetical protein